jgi:L-asparaginase II
MAEIKTHGFFRCNIYPLAKVPLMPTGIMHNAYLTGTELAFALRHVGLVEIMDGVLVILPEASGEAQA